MSYLNKLNNPLLQCDSYKFSHVYQCPAGTTKTYSHLTPRSTKRLQKNIPTLDNKIVSFGLQYTVKHLLDEWNTYFFNLPWEEVNATVLDVLAPHIGFTAASMEKFKALHTLGYLPLEIKGIPEGDRVSAGIPLLTITNTHDDFDWLPNFLESKILNTSYIPFTVATLAYELAKLRDKYWNISVDSEAGKEFALHDFHFRGAHTSYAAAISSMAYTLITKGTDTVNSIPAAQYYYNTKNPTSFSIPATEHSTASLGIAYYGKLVYQAFVDTQGDTFEDLLENIINKLSMSTGMSRSELYPLVEACLYVDNNFNATVKENETVADKKLQLQQALGECFNLGRLLTVVYPTGLFAYVSDTYDFWRTVELIVPALKNIITKRDGKLILRPDCYSEDTQVLTDRGFVFFKDLIETDKIAQVLDDGSYEFVKPLKIVNEPYKGKMYHFKDHHGKVDQLVTPNHRMIYKQINPSNHSVITEKVVFAEKMKKTGNGLNYFERSARAQNLNKTLTDLEKLNIAFQADGSYSTGCNNSIRFSFSKERKIERLSTLLIKMKLPFKIYDLKDGKKEFNITVSKNLMHKDFNWVDISNLCSNWCKEFLEELKHWDSSIRNAGRFKYDTTTKSCSSVVELIAVSAGKGVFTTESEDNREEHFSNVFTSHIMDNNKAGGQSWVKEEVYYDGTIHCVQVPTGRLIVKRNRSIMVCGNSGNPVDVLCGQMYIGNSYEDLDVSLNENEYGWCYNEQGIKRYYKATDTALELVNVKDIPAIQKGVVRSLWDTFGGTVNNKGFKVLDPHISVVYGDGMFFERIEQIYKQTIDNEFSIENFCLAVGAWMLSGITRDDLGVAIKASAFVVNGEVVPVYKQPVTDASKNSVKGFLKVVKGENGEYSLIDNVSMEEEKETALQTVFLNGQLQNQVSYETVINRLFKQT